MVTSADQTGASQVSALEIYATQIRSVENCIAKIKAAKGYTSIMIKLSSLSKNVSEVDKREARTKIMQFTPLVPSRLAFKKP